MNRGKSIIELYLKLESTCNIVVNGRKLILDNFRGLLSGFLIGDRGLLSKTVHAELAGIGNDLQTPLRDNMENPRPKTAVQRLPKVCRRVEIAIRSDCRLLACNPAIA